MGAKRQNARWLLRRLALKLLVGALPVREIPAMRPASI